MAGRDARFELLTARGFGGVAVVAVTGADRRAALAGLVDGDRTGPGPRLVRIRLGGAVVDEALWVERPRIGSIELHLHGSAALLDAFEDAVGGFRPPAARAPAAALLQRARGDAQLALALEQLELGTFAGFAAATARVPAAARAIAVAAARARTRTARALADTARCVLAGRQNTGKSTLMNRLAFAPRALAGPSPGLTRDPVREVVVLAGYPYELVDTAGEGPAVDPLDRVAQDRARRARAGAPLLLLVADGSRSFGAIERRLARRATLVVRTKADLPQSTSWPPLDVPSVAVSCVDPARSPDVRAALGDALRRARALPDAPPSGVGGPAALTDEDERMLAELERQRDSV